MPTDAPISLDQFRAQARHSPDLSTDVDPAVRDAFQTQDYPEGVPAGWVYPGGLVIQDYEQAPLQGQRYYLQIGNREWLSNDRAELEPLLYDFYDAECDA